MLIDVNKYVQKALYEAFESRIFNKGQVNFKKSSLNDPHLQKVIAFISKSTKEPISEIISKIQESMNKFKNIADVAPILYGTIMNNHAESEVFDMFWKLPNRKVPGAPEFEKLEFNTLLRSIKIEHDSFFPLRSFLDPKHLSNPNVMFSGTPESIAAAESKGPDKKKNWESVTTAAATPSGDFIFNVPFMQALIDWAHLVNLKPKGLKYVSNGGEIPDEYAYIEFLIIHELFHYAHDDFHYQKMIPGANPTIINWVGDFRSNYLLVKSGYEQIPMGLFNDDINLDRQKNYIEMYNLVKAEMDKLPKEDQDKVSEKMDDMSDDHEPGTEDGAQSDAGEGESVDKITERSRKIEESMEKGKDKGPGEGGEEGASEGEGKDGKGRGERGGRGSASNDTPTGIDYTKVQPTKNWKTIVAEFVNSANQQTEETYEKPAPRGISGIHTARQVGAGAMKPGEIPVEYREAKICAVVDSSGSMHDVIETVYSNMVNLFKKNPGLQKTEFTLIGFSGSHHIYKGVFSKNKAGLVANINEKPIMNLSLQTVFNQTFNGVTNFTSTLTSDISDMLKKKYNVIIFSDSDIVSGENFRELMTLFKVPGGKLFIVFDCRESYIQFRQAAGMTTPNITYFG